MHPNPQCIFLRDKLSELFARNLTKYIVSSLSDLVFSATNPSQAETPQLFRILATQLLIRKARQVRTCYLASWIDHSTSSWRRRIKVLDENLTRIGMVVDMSLQIYCRSMQPIVEAVADTRYSNLIELVHVLKWWSNQVEPSWNFPHHRPASSCIWPKLVFCKLKAFLHHTFETGVSSWHRQWHHCGCCSASLVTVQHGFDQKTCITYWFTSPKHCQRSRPSTFHGIAKAESSVLPDVDYPRSWIAAVWAFKGRKLHQWNSTCSEVIEV